MANYSGTIAIETKSHGPTDHKGARVSAVCCNCENGGRVTVPYDHGEEVSGAHLIAALAHLEKHHKWALGGAGEPVLHHTVRLCHGVRGGYVWPLVDFLPVEVA